MTRCGLAIALAAVVALTVACGLPEDARKRGEMAGQQLEEAAQLIEGREAQLAQGLASHPAIAPYAEREEWSAHFTRARSELAEARARFEREVLPLLEADREEDAAALEAATAPLRATAARLRRGGQWPIERAAQLLRAQEEGPEWLAASATELAAVSAQAQRVEDEIARATRDHPSQRTLLSQRVDAVRERVAAAREGLQNARVEIERGASRDLASTADGLVRLETALAEAREIDELTSRGLPELYRSYSKTLLDMKQEFTVEIGRTSWNERYDFPSESEYRYPLRKVSEEIATELEARGERPIAANNGVQVSREAWQALALDPAERLPAGDNAFELWLADSRVSYFHRYLLVEGSERSEGDWEPVSEEFFEAHQEDLGMDIVAKPYGVFEPEALSQAMPPGYGYVGNAQYGSWEDDPQGRRRWSWGPGFLWYGLMFGGNRHHYYYDDWNRWDRDYRGRRAYYGERADGTTSYGSRGRVTRSGARFAGSAWARSGGFRRSDASVRGAAGSLRGGGPGGRGK